MPMGLFLISLTFGTSMASYDAMNYFVKFEKFIPRSITIPSFMTIGSQMAELDRGGGGGFWPPPHIK